MISVAYDITQLKTDVKAELSRQQEVLTWKLEKRTTYIDETLNKIYELNEGLNALDRGLLTTRQQQDLASYLRELI